MRDFNFRSAVSLSGFANMSTTQRKFRLSLVFFAERKQSAILLSES